MKKTKAKSRSAATKKARPAKVSPIPETHRTITPGICVNGGAKAIEFYQKAFGAKVKFRMDMPDGKIGHAELQIGDSLIMLGDECAEMGFRAPSADAGSPVHFYLYVPDVDASWKRALAAGCTVKQPLNLMFWGDRVGKVSDPFGHQWSIASRVEIVSIAECLRRAEKAMAKPQPEPVAT